MRVIRQSQGFTLLELVVVVAIVGTMVLLAMPNFTDWAKESSYKEAARDIAGTFKLAKSDAISVGTDRTVEVTIVANPDDGRDRFHIMAGSTDYHENVVPSNVQLKLGNGNMDTDPCGIDSGTYTVVFRSNGTVASPDFRFACVMDAPGTNEEYRVKLMSLVTGRLEIERR